MIAYHSTGADHPAIITRLELEEEWAFQPPASFYVHSFIDGLGWFMIN
jgi:hypothetical protein